MAMEIGARVVDKDGWAGIVRYLGPVATSKKASTTWAGIEWLEDGRGKHDGAVVDLDGVSHRYFTCPAERGSFLKPKRLSTGQSLPAAIRGRYGEGAAELTAADAAEMTVGTVLGGSRAVEFVGSDKLRSQQALSALTKVSVARSGVSTAGEAGELSALVPRVVELDLGGSPLPDWQQLAAIGAELPALRLLRLSGCRFAPLTAEALAAPSLTSAFPSLSILVLNSTGASWPSVLQLAAAALPALTELHLVRNGLRSLSPDCDGAGADAEEGAEEAKAADDLPPPLAGLSQLRVLNVDENELSSWRELQRLRELPKLEKVMLSGNAIDSIAYAGGFLALTALSLNRTPIAHWSVVDALDAFPALHTLRLQRVPLTEPLGASTGRQLTIARLSSLISLNGGEVRPRERRDAEKKYIKRALMELHAVLAAAATAAADGGSEADSEEAKQAAKADFDRRHPRLAALTELHGLPDMVAAAAGGAATAGLATGLVKVSIKSMAPDSITEKAKVKKLPLTMTIADLKQLCQRLYRIDVDVMSLFHREAEDSFGHPAPMDDDMRTLSFYGLVDGEEILVEEIDPRERARAAARKAEEEAAEAERQAAEAEALAAAKASAIRSAKSSVMEAAGAL